MTRLKWMATKVVVVNSSRFAKITKGFPTSASHLVTTVLLHNCSFAFRALADHDCCHFLFAERIGDLFLVEFYKRKLYGSDVHTSAFSPYLHLDLPSPYSFDRNGTHPTRSHRSGKSPLSTWHNGKPCRPPQALQLWLHSHTDI